jgi:hypothetical protein
MSDPTGQSTRDFTAWLREENRKLLHLLAACIDDAARACRDAIERIAESRQLLNQFSGKRPPDAGK